MPGHTLSPVIKMNIFEDENRSEGGVIDISRVTPTPSSSSRIIVKNLPKYITADRLRKHFSIKGHAITDLKLAQTK